MTGCQCSWCLTFFSVGCASRLVVLCTHTAQIGRLFPYTVRPVIVQEFIVFVVLCTHRAYGVLLWEITSYGLTPLNQYEARDVIQMAESGSLKHIQ